VDRRALVEQRYEKLRKLGRFAEGEGK
jgi:hypothetical protein